MRVAGIQVTDIDEIPGKVAPYKAERGYPGALERAAIEPRASGAIGNRPGQHAVPEVQREARIDCGLRWCLQPSEAKYPNMHLMTGFHVAN